MEDFQHIFLCWKIIVYNNHSSYSGTNIWLASIINTLLAGFSLSNMSRLSLLENVLTKCTLSFYYKLWENLFTLIIFCITLQYVVCLDNILVLLSTTYHVYSPPFCVGFTIWSYCSPSGAFLSNMAH